MTTMARTKMEMKKTGLDSSLQSRATLIEPFGSGRVNWIQLFLEPAAHNGATADQKYDRLLYLNLSFAGVED